MQKYKNIIDLPHKQSSKRPHMSLSDRAAQFAPFAALTGYDDAIVETGRLTDKKIELSEEALDLLNVKYQILLAHLADNAEIILTYFVPDKNKSGGAYVEKQGVVKRLDIFERQLILCDGTKILMDDILTISGDIFDSLLKTADS